MQMRRADLGDVHLQRRMLPNDVTRRTGVVEVDVREQEVAQILQRDTVIEQSLLQPLEAGRGAAVEERRAVCGLYDVDRDHALRAQELKVDRPVEHGADGTC